MSDPVVPPLPLAILRTVFRFAVLLALAWAVHRVMTWAEARLVAGNLSWAMPGFTVLLLLVYALCIAMPFVPGVEIGLSMMAINGPGAAPSVWLATALGLSLAYLAGSRVPYSWLYRFFLDLRITGACRLLERFANLPPPRRVSFLQSNLPTRLGPLLVKYRYVGLALLINVPGNSLIGGGGGIALLAGISGLFRTALAILTIALATAPVPLLVWFFKWQIPFFE